MTSQLCVFPTLCFSWSRHIRRINMKSLCWLRTSPELKQITTKEWSSLQTDGKVFVRLSCSYLNVDKISVVLLTFPQGKRFYKLKSCHRAYRSAISVVYHLNPIWVCGVPQGSILVYFQFSDCLGKASADSSWSTSSFCRIVGILLPNSNWLLAVDWVSTVWTWTHMGFTHSFL